MPADPAFALDPRVDRAVIRRVFAATGRVHIPGVLTPPSAQRLYDALRTATPWQISTLLNGRHVDLDPDQLRGMPMEERRVLEESITRNARDGFQYIFNNYPVYDLYTQQRCTDHVAVQLCGWLNSEPFLDFARQITGLEHISIVDAQATLYRPGHFLTTHDDLVEGKDRLAAYVLNLTPKWRADWGGVLQFIDQDGHVAEGYVPAWNALNVFRVPQRHSVSFVTPAALEGRYSIAGWLRAS